MSLIEPNETQQLVLAQAGEHLPGTPYRIIEKIGGGGMGQVFLGEHTELGREVAIKLLAPQLAEDAQAMERLRREARAAARIGHPHIIDTYDLGVSDDGRPYVVMRNIRGHDLKKVLDTQAPLSPARVLHLARQIASALAAAHKVGIIHRDLKPENVMVEVEGRVSEHVTVLDFGIAQSIQDGDTRLTRAGQVIGTPGYMAPEQALAQPLDGRADEYSLAVICYELLNGDSPYPRNTPLQVIAAQLTQAPRAFKVSTIPEPIRAVVLRGMARQAEDRYAGVDAFIEALEIAVEQAEAEAPPEAGRLQRLMVITLAALVLLGGGYLGYRALSAAPVDARPDSGLSAMASAPDAALKAMANTPDAALKAMANTPDAALKAPDAALKAPDAALKAPDTQQARQRARRLAMAAKREAAREAAKREEAAREAAKREEAARQAAKREEAAREAAKREEAAREAAKREEAARQAAKREEAARQAAQPGQLSFSRARVKGGASDRQVNARLKAAEGDIRACAATIPAGRRAEVVFTVDGDGFFIDVGGRGDPALLACGVQGVKRLGRLGRRPDTGQVEVTLPLKMEAR